jgi:hypothetical protein
MGEPSHFSLKRSIPYNYTLTAQGSFHLRKASRSGSAGAFFFAAEVFGQGGVPERGTHGTRVLAVSRPALGQSDCQSVRLIKW